MITGLHALLYSKDAEADRAFFRDVLGRRCVDAGDGWLIFNMPPAELGIHPAEEQPQHELWLMCDDLEATVKEFVAKGVPVAAVIDAGWGLRTTITLPSGGELGLYEPRHPTALEG